MAPVTGVISSDEFDFSSMCAGSAAGKTQAAPGRSRQQDRRGAVRRRDGAGDGGWRDAGAARFKSTPRLFAANDKAMIEDLITVAVNEGLRQAQTWSPTEMGKLGPMGGLNLRPVFGEAADSNAGSRAHGGQSPIETLWPTTLSSAPRACRRR